MAPKLSFSKVKYKYVLRVTDATGVSIVHVVNNKGYLEKMGKMIEMGFREGFIMILNALGKCLKRHTGLKRRVPPLDEFIVLK